MRYITEAYLIERYGRETLLQLTDRDDTGVVGQAMLSQAIEDAETQIDSYLAERYRLPLQVVPGSLKRHAGSMAYYLLFNDAPTETAQKHYDQAMTWLKDIAAGRATLQAEGREAASAAGRPQAQAGEKVFTDQSLEGFVDGRRRG